MEKIDRNLLRPVVAVIGLLLVGMPFVSESFAEADLWTRGLTVLGGAVLLLHVYAVFARDRSIRAGKTLTLRGEGGESVIAIDALEDLLRDEVCKAKDVRDVDVDLEVRAEGEPIQCELRFKLDNQADIPGRTEAHKQTVRDAFERLLPGSPELNITCRVEDIILSRAPRESESGKNREDFAGPVYPVPGDEESEQGY
jgi:hypothetical protein